ncbi:MAG: hypothetical protein QOI62_1325 [Solirubrobacteraceae bacterium]|nr:hypothetical protein [Solirubrobacteraceae bacterium]
MAAREDQAQAVVGQRAGIVVVGRLLVVAVELHEPVQGREAVVQFALAAQAVDRPAPSGGGDPGARARRLAVARPGGERDGEGVLERVLGELEVAAEMADQRGEDPPGLLAEGVLDRGGHMPGIAITGRTSTVP